MSEINVLDSSIFNRIAAGEVVENPKSVVKELVENSIDAGADTITVELRNGGIEYISVTDNGKGINKADMPIAFLPHATSKIHSLKDLEAISTLGFRGEALPSIASVAEVEMASRTQNSELGYKITLKEGKIIDEGECGIPFGTKTTVKNLFANIPARAKFLRKPQSEEGDTTELIIKIILANPHLKIKYIVNGETRYQSDGNGLKSAIYSIYGSDFLNNMADISCTMPDIQLYGVIGTPHYTKHNRNYQTLIVNGRYVVNSDIGYCIQQCYQTYLMKRQFPVYILYLNLPGDMVDVNVHPNKLDVRFSNEKHIKSVIYNTVKSKVDELAAFPAEYTPQTQPPAFDTRQEEISKIKHDISTIGRNKNTLTDNPVRFNTQSLTSICNTIEEPSVIKTKIGDFIRDITPEPSRPVQREPQVYSQPLNTSFFENAESVKFTGKLFNTYLLAECGNNFYIIDQHAAHEKLLYDKLTEQVNKNDSAVQDLLVPYIFDVSPSEKGALCERLPEINDYGFKIDLLSGCSFSLYALPSCCTNINLKKFVSLLLCDMDNIKRGSEYIKEDLMQAACKSAVKGEDNLNESEIESLIKQMKESDSAKFCPHGRPTVIKFGRDDLEKLFKRI